MNRKIEKLLTELEKLNQEWVANNVDFEHTYGRIPGEKEIRLWQIPRTTGEYLYFLVTLLKPKRILEIGTGAGYSAIWLAAAAEEYGGGVETIEIFEPKIQLAKQYIKNSGLKNIKLLIGEAKSITENYSKSVDMLFLDADKENYSYYFQKLFKSFRKGTLIIADNAGNYGHLMQNYFNTLKKNRKVLNHFLNIDNGLMLTQVL